MNTNNKYEITVFEENDNADLIEYSEKMKESIETALDNNKGKQGDVGPAPIKGTDYFTNEEIQEIENNVLDRVNQFSVEVVEVLPSENISEHTIYFMPQKNAKQQDVYDEYMFINEGWEHIGTTEVDLSNYYNKEQVDEKVEGGIGDLVVNHKNSTITAPTIQGFGKIHKLYGKTEEVGSGEKSPSNPYEISCVADDVNLLDISKISIGTKNGVTATLDGDIITLNGTCTVDNTVFAINPLDKSIKNINNTTTIFVEYLSGDMQNATNTTNVALLTSDWRGIPALLKKENSVSISNIATNDIFTMFQIRIDNNVVLNNYKIRIKVSQSTKQIYSKYGEGSIEITSTDGTNTSNKVISCKPLCCLKDSENNIIAQDYIDFDRQKIHKELRYLVLDGSDDENWIMQTNSSVVQNTVQNFYSNNIYDGNKGLSGVTLICNRFKNQDWATGISLDDEFVANISSSQSRIGIKIKKSRLSSVNADGLKAWLRNNPLIIIFKLAQTTEEDIDITNSIVQYANQTTISNSDNAEMEIELTNNKAISSINENIAELQDSTNKLKEIYSTEERVVGRWIDGKPLYRKVIVSNGNVGEEVAINHNISNFRQATDIRATTTSMGPLTYLNNNNKYSLIVTSINSTSIVAKIGNAFGDWNIYFTLEYTKTTD